MSERKRSYSRARLAKRRMTRTKKVVLAMLAVVVLVSSAGLASPLLNWKRHRANAMLSSPPPPVPAPGNPSKEYIYAGSRLLATEERPNLLAPASLTATSITNLGSPQIMISWQATAGADHYEVEKTNRLDIPYSSVSSNVTATSFTDNSVSGVTAYLYRVRAVDASGNPSPFSNVDLATAVTFTDDSLQSQVTFVKAVHLNELRQSVDAIRITALLPAINWGGSLTQFQTEVQAAHIQDLRDAVNAARTTLQLTPCTFSDNSLTALRATFISKAHIDELRQCVR